MRRRASPVTEISLTELVIFPYEHSRPGNRDKTWKKGHSLFISITGLKLPIRTETGLKYYRGKRAEILIWTEDKIRPDDRAHMKRPLCRHLGP